MSKVIHHHRFTTVRQETVNYWTWCGKHSFNDRCDDIESITTDPQPSKELDSSVDLSDYAKKTRRIGNHCKRCLEERIKYYGYEYMQKLGYPVEKFKDKT